MKKLKNLITFLCLSIFSILVSGPLKVLADNNITGPVEAYTYKAQTVTFQLQTDNPWRAETDYDFIHLNASNRKMSGIMLKGRSPKIIHSRGSYILGTF